MEEREMLWDFVCRQYGVQYNEVFTLSEKGSIRYRITKEEGLEFYDVNDETWSRSYFTEEFLQGKMGELVKLKWRPSIGEFYYYVALLKGKEPIVLKEKRCNESTETYLLMLGNIFRTKEDAEAHKMEILEKLGAEKKIARISTEDKENAIKNKLFYEGFHRGDVVRCQDEKNVVEIGIDKETGDLMISPKDRAFPKRIDAFYKAAILHSGKISRIYSDVLVFDTQDCKEETAKKKKISENFYT